MNKRFDENVIIDRLENFFRENGYEVQVQIEKTNVYRPDLIVVKKKKRYVVEVKSRIYSTNQLFSVIFHLIRYQTSFDADYSFLVTTVKLGSGFLKMIRRMGVGYIFVDKESIEILSRPKEDRAYNEALKSYSELNQIIRNKIAHDVYQKEFRTLLNNFRDNLTYYSMIDTKIKKVSRPPDRDLISDKLVQEIEEMPNFLYKEELVFFIEKQSSEDIPLFNITMDTLKRLWKKHEKNEVYDMFENFKDFEPMLFKNTPYRDHFLHQFQVFLLGCPIIYNQMNKITQSCNKYIKGDFSQNNIFFSWLLASTFHDIGYPIQQIPTWINSFFNDYIHVENLPLSVDFSGILSERNFMEYIDKLCSLLSHFSVESKGRWAYMDKINVDNKIRNLVLEKLLQNRNHGIISSLCLLDVIENGKYAKDHPNYKEQDFSSSVAPAALSILLHDADIFSEDLINSIRFERNPFSFLLIFCDTVQEWGRPSTIKFERSDDFEPFLTDLEIKDNKISVELTYNSENKKEIFEKKCKEVKNVFKKIRSPDPVFSIKIKLKGEPSITYDSN